MNQGLDVYEIIYAPHFAVGKINKVGIGITINYSLCIELTVLVFRVHFGLFAMRKHE